MKKCIYHGIKERMWFKRELSWKLRSYLVREHILDCLDITNYMSIRTWASEKICPDGFLVAVHHSKNLLNAPGNLVFPQKTKYAFNRIVFVSTGKCSRVRKTIFLYKKHQKRRRPAEHRRGTYQDVLF